jgi:hypothetical protein
VSADSFRRGAGGIRKARIGCAGWSIPAAHRDRFGGGASALARYATRLHCVEINSSFHRSHKRETYARWAAAVPAQFRFAVKMPRTISHDALAAMRPTARRVPARMRRPGEQARVSLVAVAALARAGCASSGTVPGAVAATLGRVGRMRATPCELVHRPRRRALATASRCPGRGRSGYASGRGGTGRRPHARVLALARQPTDVLLRLWRRTLARSWPRGQRCRKRCARELGRVRQHRARPCDRRCTAVRRDGGAKRSPIHREGRSQGIPAGFPASGKENCRYARSRMRIPLLH